MKLAKTVLTAFVLAACTHAQAWVATGESIDALGKTFVITGRALDAAYTKGLVTEAQYDRWRSFVTYFQPTYDLAADRWLHADDSAHAHAAAVLAALSAELATFTALAGVKPPPVSYELPREEPGAQFAVPPFVWVDGLKLPVMPAVANCIIQTSYPPRTSCWLPDGGAP